MLIRHRCHHDYFASGSAAWFSNVVVLNPYDLARSLSGLGRINSGRLLCDSDTPRRFSRFARVVPHAFSLSVSSLRGVSIVLTQRLVSCVDLRSNLPRSRVICIEISGKKNVLFVIGADIFIQLTRR